LARIGGDEQCDREGVPTVLSINRERETGRMQMAESLRASVSSTNLLACFRCNHVPRTSGHDGVGLAVDDELLLPVVSVTIGPSIM
jgi:hypothetical protein